VPLKHHPTDPDKLIFVKGEYDLQKPWVGLTTQELHKCVVETGIHVFEGDIYKFVAMLEKILQAKNT